MDIQIQNSIEEFDRLREDWDRLLHQSSRATVFNSWEWQYYWWKHYGNSHQLQILVVTRDAEVICIAPLYIRRIRPFGLFTIKSLQWIGTGGDTSPDYLDLLCLAEGEAAISQRLASYILREWTEWDAIHWTDMPKPSLLHQELTKQGNASFQLEQGISSRISQVELPATWDQFMGSLTRKTRNKIRNRKRHMEADLRGRFLVWQDKNTLDHALETLTRLHHDRWKGRARKFAFSSDAYIAFHSDVMHAFHARDWLRIYCLAVGERVIAMDYCYQFKKRVMQFQRGFDSEYRGRSPGFVLMCRSFQQAIYEGNLLFDFLKGEYAHKKEFETRSTTTQYLNCYRKSRITQIYQFLKRARKQIRSLNKINS